MNGKVVQKFLWDGLGNWPLAVYHGNDSPLMVFHYADARLPLAMTANGVNHHLCCDQAASTAPVPPLYTMAIF